VGFTITTYVRMVSLVKHGVQVILLKKTSLSREQFETFAIKAWVRVIDMSQEN